MGSGFIADGSPWEVPESAADQGYANTPLAGGGLGADIAAFGTIVAGQFQRFGISQSAGGNRAGMDDDHLIGADEANKLYSSPGTSLFDRPILQSMAKIIGKEHADQAQRDAYLQRWAAGANPVEQFTVPLAASLLDPVNVAGAFVPGLGEATFAANIGRVGLTGFGGRILARAAAGATGFAAATPGFMALQYLESAGTHDPIDFSLRGAASQLVYSAALGALLHTGTGLLSSQWRAGGLPESAPPPGADLRGTPTGWTADPVVAAEARAVENAPAATTHAAIGTAVAQILEGRPVDVEPIFRDMTAAEEEAFAARTGAVAGAPPEAAAAVPRAEAPVAAQPQETVVSPAVRFEGRIFSGPTHSAAWAEAMDAGIKPNDNVPVEEVDGFVTSTGRYVSRSEATKIADAAGQKHQGEFLESERDFPNGQPPVARPAGDNAGEPAKIVPAAAPPAPAAGDTLGAAPKVPTRKPVRLLRWLASQGGIRDFKGELAALGLTDHFVPGYGRLVRASGRTLDMARERAAEAGFFDDFYGNRQEAMDESTVDDLLTLLREDKHGNPVYSALDEDVQRATEESAAQRRAEAAAEKAVEEEIVTAGGAIDAPTQALMSRAAKIVMAEGIEPIEALERAALQLESEEATPLQRAEIADAIPGWDEAQADARTVPQGGGPGGEAGAQGRGGEAADGGAGIAEAGTGDGDGAVGINTYHGSPHEVAQFDLGKVGTGEGAQSFGHGLYFAEERGVSETYTKDREEVLRHGRESLEASTKAIADVTGFQGRVRVQKNEAHAPSVKARWEIFGVVRRGGLFRKPVEKYLGDIQELLDGSFFPHVNDKVDQLIASRRMIRGHVYDVRLNVDRASLLDLDKPINEQTPEIQQRLAEAFKDDLTAPTVAGISMKALDWVKSMEAHYGDPAAVSRWMRDAGIPGSTYLDQGSRDAGEGSRNIVLFDDSLAEITARDKVPVVQSPADLAEQQAQLYRDGYDGGLPQTEFDAMNNAVYGEAAKSTGGAVSPSAASAKIAGIDADIAEAERELAGSGAVPGGDLAAIEQSRASVAAADQRATAYEKAGGCLTDAGV